MTAAPTLALSDRRAVAAASQCEFREGWSFKGKPEPVIDRMIGATPGPIIHGCCGAARLVREDLRVDLYHPSADRKWDLREIDKRCAEEGIRPGTIFIDPPYGKKMWPLPYRQKVVNACMRALRPVGHDACCQGNCGPRVRCQGCKEPVVRRVAERIATFGVSGSTEFWHSWCWGKALEDNPEWQDATYQECETCGGDGMLDDVMPCGDCVNGRVEY